jgi:hypothetical protein
VDGDHHVIGLVDGPAVLYETCMTQPNVETALRAVVTAAALATAFAAHRTLFRDADRRASRRAGFVLGTIAAVAAAASHVDAAAQLAVRVFPAGLALGIGLAVASLFWSSTRRAFDRMRDGDVRLLVGTRAAFGAMLLGYGALGLLPESFALSAGIGDVVAACLAIGAPGSLDRAGSRATRAVVHGVGLLDMMMVVAEAILVVRPFAMEHPGVVTSMTLPWVVVPLMVAVNLHGVRQVLASPRVAESLRDGPEPARGVRRALS